jgi:hypothetical protein
MTDSLSPVPRFLGDDDLDRIAALPLTDPAEVAHSVRNEANSIFTWDYSQARPGLRRLYERAKVGQWNASTDLDWSIDVDAERIVTMERVNGYFPVDVASFAGTSVERWNDATWIQFAMDNQNWRVSQFLHGEQGALICASKIVETVPWYDAKLFAATQVIDEARHVEVFGRYLTEKLGSWYPINAHLRMLLDDIVSDARWDVTYLGMQIMVEGLALAAFGFAQQITADPLLRQLLKYVMSDEARHVAFGVVSLAEVYASMSSVEIRERQEFAFEAALCMRNRFLQQEVWERFEVDLPVVVRALQHDRGYLRYQRMLFAKVVPNCRKLGLLDASDGWLRQRFTELGVIGFEHFEDSEQEQSAFELARDA